VGPYGYYGLPVIPYGYSPITGAYYPWPLRSYYTPPVSALSYTGQYAGSYYPAYPIVSPLGYRRGPYDAPRYYAQMRGGGEESPAPAPGTAQTRQNTVRMTVTVPVADAEVWVEGRKTQRQGTVREFVSPPLDPSRRYVYEVRARWMEDGRPVERKKSVAVQANRSVEVDFRTSERVSEGSGPAKE
jgi:uncharacterized protein (TIGR03000 family)